MPLLILGLVTPSIADAGKGARKLLLTVMALSYLSTCAAALFGYFAAGQLLPHYVARGAVAVSVFLFGLSSAVGWYAYYVTLIHHAFSSEKTRTRLLNAVTFLAPALGVVLTAVVGLLGEGSELIWTIADFSAVLPTFINLSVLLCMSGRFGELVADYERKK